MAVCVHWIFGQFAFVGNAVETYCTKMNTGILYTNDISTVINEAINMDNVNQHYQISIKYFSIQFDINGINKDIEYIKYDYVNKTGFSHFTIKPTSIH